MAEETSTSTSVMPTPTEQDQQSRIYLVIDGLKSSHTKRAYRLAFDRFLNTTVAVLLARSMTETQIAQELGVDQSTVSRDVRALKVMSQQFVYDLAKSDLAYYFKQSINGIEEAKKESWKIYNDDTVPVRDKLLALRLIMQSEETRFKLLSEGPSILAVKALEDRLTKIEHQEKQQ